MPYQKKYYQSELFGDAVWIVNISIEQAYADPEIADSGKIVFTWNEINILKTIPTEQRERSYPIFYRFKLAFPKSEITRIGEHIPIPDELIYTPEPTVKETERIEKIRLKRVRRMTLEIGDEIGQERLGLNLSKQAGKYGIWREDED